MWNKTEKDGRMGEKEIKGKGREREEKGKRKKEQRISEEMTAEKTKEENLVHTGTVSLYKEEAGGVTGATDARGKRDRMGVVLYWFFF